MKYPVKSIALALFCVFFGASAMAEQQPMTGMSGQGMRQGMGQKGQMGMGMGMGMGMMNMSDEQLRAMQEDMLKMHDLMNRINAATDPEEKNRLKDEHLEMMKAHHAKMKERRQSMMRQGMKMDQPAGEESQ